MLNLPIHVIEIGWVDDCFRIFCMDFTLLLSINSFPLGLQVGNKSQLY